MHDIENYMLEEHWELRQAATELMCNMSVYSETIKWFEDEKYDRLKVTNNHNFCLINCFVGLSKMTLKPFSRHLYNS